MNKHKTAKQEKLEKQVSANRQRYLKEEKFYSENPGSKHFRMVDGKPRGSSFY